LLDFSLGLKQGSAKLPQTKLFGHYQALRKHGKNKVLPRETDRPKLQDLMHFLIQYKVKDRTKNPCIYMLDSSNMVVAIIIATANKMSFTQ